MPGTGDGNFSLEQVRRANERMMSGREAQPQSGTVGADFWSDLNKAALAAANRFDQRGWPIETLMPPVAFDGHGIAPPDPTPFLDLFEGPSALKATSADPLAAAQTEAINQILPKLEKLQAAAKALGDYVDACFEHEDMTKTTRWKWQKNSGADLFNKKLAAFTACAYDFDSMPVIKEACETFAQVAQTGFHLARAWHAARDKKTGLGNAAAKDNARWEQLRAALYDACTGSAQDYDDLVIVRAAAAVRDIKREVADAMQRCFISRSNDLQQSLAQALSTCQSARLGQDCSVIDAMRETPHQGTGMQEKSVWKGRLYHFLNGVSFVISPSKRLSVTTAASLLYPAIRYAAFTTTFSLVNGFAMAAINVGAKAAQIWVEKRHEKMVRIGLRSENDSLKSHGAAVSHPLPWKILGGLTWSVTLSTAALAVSGQIYNPNSADTEKSEPAATAPASANRDPSTLSTPKGDLKIEFDQKGSAAKPTALPTPKATEQQHQKNANSL